MKKGLISISLIATILISGCSVKGVKKESNDFKIPEKLDILHDSSYEPVKRIKTEFVSKYDVNNHKIPEILEKQHIKLVIKKGMTLEEATKDFPIHVIAKDSLMVQMLPSITLDGSPSEILEQLSALVSGYWHYDKGSVIFTETKTVIYRFPVFSQMRLNNIYNISSETSDRFDGTKIKSDIFDEMKTLLNTVLNNRVEIINIESSTQKTTTNSHKNKEGKKAESTIQDAERKSDINQNIVSKENSEENDNLFRNKIDKENKKQDKYKIKVDTSKKQNNKKSKVVKSIPAIELGKEIDKGYNNNINDTNTKENSKKLKEVKGTNEKNKKESEKQIQNNKNNTSSNMGEKINEDSIVQGVKLIKNVKMGHSESKIAISKESGIIVAEITRDTERYLDVIINKTVKNMLQNMVMLELYILEIKETNSDNFTADINSLINNVTNLGKDAISYGSSNGVVYNLNQISGAQPKYLDVGAIIGYIQEKLATKVLSNPKILTLSNIPSRLKATTDIPYLEPSQVSVGGSTNSQLSYEIKYVNDGVDIAVLNTVIGEDILMGLGITINQYLGDKTIKAGELGTFDLPIQAPRIFDTTIRVKAGDMVVFGGIKSKKYNKTKRSNVYVPTQDSDEFEENKILIVASPTLFKFIDNENEEEISKMNKSIIKKKQLQIEEIERLKQIASLKQKEKEDKEIVSDKEDTSILQNFIENINKKHHKINHKNELSKFSEQKKPVSPVDSNDSIHLKSNIENTAINNENEEVIEENIISKEK